MVARWKNRPDYSSMIEPLLALIMALLASSIGEELAKESTPLGK
jgi:hypothetical protein